MKPGDIISIGALAERTGASVSAIRFYEKEGLITPMRSGGNQRRYLRADIRRLSFIRIAQQLGLSLEDIRGALASLPYGRTPNAKDWAKLAAAIREDLNRRIERLTRLRDNLDGCIGCGCLSMKTCALWNPEDAAREKGAGPRWVIGDRPSQMALPRKA
ncbi:redox-sensitive transcriptional activator SoxR [Pacificimonas aurantium]|uniref:Redox-sensitive transcriptional activator SoxR n=1 Tax=Pacificimonas aurantium TaxID=1250540 RepID=A0ABS7WFS4_9SPHN|nr:redox-sensitive transcriptional activator SoxR [Pacificimonas flava]MBZ6377243.1 redox-sensitive transcriptional activator SoxR [Pacificimonas aurantium]